MTEFNVVPVLNTKEIWVVSGKSQILCVPTSKFLKMELYGIVCFRKLMKDRQYVK